MQRDYESAPVSAQLGLANVIAGLVSDLDELRAGRITVPDAVARSLLAKQIFNGVRIYMNGTKILSDNARALGSPEGVAPRSAEPRDASKGEHSEAHAQPDPSIRTTP